MSIALKMQALSITLDGNQWRDMVVAGSQKVIARQDYLNKINVFPVPDGDTGTNMAYTFSVIHSVIGAVVETNLSLMSQKIADAALDGARGNSGAIVAQFLTGLCEGIGAQKTVTTRQFAQAVQTAKEKSYEALSKPTEGTILTVITDWADALSEHSQNLEDFKTLFQESLVRAKKSLSETTSKLKVLEKAGVVDAGAQGFVDLLEGIQEFIATGKVEKVELIEVAEAPEGEFTEEFRYCTECIIEGENIDQKSLRQQIQILGNSLVVAGGIRKTKVHIHTDDPGRLFRICKSFGVLKGEKADDMVQQQREVHGQHSDIGILVDSGCDIDPVSMEKLNIHMVPVRLNFGNQHFVDKVTISSDEFWQELKTNPTHPQTSQPTQGDLKRKYDLLKLSYKHVVAIHIPAEASGTLQASMAAAQSYKDFNIHLVDSYNLSVGFGLVAMKAAEEAQRSNDLTKVLQVIQQAVEDTQTYVLFESLEHIVKGGRVPAFKKKLADFLGFMPVLSVNKKGKPVPVGKIWGKKRLGKFLNFVLAKIDSQKKYRLCIAHAQAPQKAKKVYEFFSHYIDEEQIFQCEMGPALAVHSGPGAIVISFQPI